jgi:peptide/nickel transport system substrate-binding protein
LPSGWGADYPAPSTFFDDLFTCRSIGHDNNNPSNRSLYCNRAVDGRIAAAEAAESSDPTQARMLWSKVDKLVVDDAPIVPTFNGQDTTLVSSRVGNYENTPLDLPPLDQIWVH